MRKGFHIQVNWNTALKLNEYFSLLQHSLEFFFLFVKIEI